MPPLTLAWEYLTGYAIATDPASRDRAEWPPHPARVFMALAAAWFETEPPERPDDGREAWEVEGAALRQVEALGDPELILPPVDPGAERSAVTSYVPVNDRSGPAAATLQSCPTLARSKQARTFPRVWVGDAPCFLQWPDAEGLDPDHRAALGRLCGKVTRLGHSSSLVRMWVADAVDPPSSNAERLTADQGWADIQARAVSPGMLDMLAERYGEGPRREHERLGRQLEDLKMARKAVAGKDAKERKAALDREIAERADALSRVAARPPVRPAIGLWSGYRRAGRMPPAPAAASGHFDPDILVLAGMDGRGLPPASTLAVARALRETIMSRCGVQPVPPWVSGHDPACGPLRDGSAHLALIPLPFVDHPHADGHLLGVGLVFPRSVGHRERAGALGRLLVDQVTGQPRPVALKLGRLGVWTVRRREWSEARRSLDPDTWTAFPGGATTWASATPLVLDRFPKANRNDPGERLAWEDEVRRIVGDSCGHAGLPAPAIIDVDTTSWHPGSPRAVVKRRPLRGQAAGPRKDGMATLGDGFPPYPAKGTNASRPQVHVWLRFDRPVIGPVLLGAGRHLGYGLCKPWAEGLR